MVANQELNIYHIHFLQLISRLINYEGNFWELPSFLMIKKDTSSHVKEAYPTNVAGRVSCVRLHILFLKPHEARCKTAVSLRISGLATMFPQRNKKLR